MNIDSIKNYPTGSLVKSKHKSMLEYRQKSADLCMNEKSVNRGYYSGSFTGINQAAAIASSKATKAAKDKLPKDGIFESVLRLCDKHTVIAQNLVALILAATLRPLAIMALPGKKNKEDKQYAAGHAIASGIIGFGFSSIVMYPLGITVDKTKKSIAFLEAASAFKNNGEGFTQERFDEIKKNFKAKNYEELGKSQAFENVKNIFQVKNLEELEKSQYFDRVKKAFNVDSLAGLIKSSKFNNLSKIFEMAPDVFVFGILKAVLTIKLIKPILKYCFGLEKSKPAEQKTAEAQKQEQSKVSQIINSVIPKPELAKFAGGLK